MVVSGKAYSLLKVRGDKWRGIRVRGKLGQGNENRAQTEWTKRCKMTQGNLLKLRSFSRNTGWLQ